ncbi:putative signaling protein containing multidomains (PAS/GGDEF/EAL) [Bradyrhizobium sp. ORS 375]|uniref:bifunctional diguanylate cyclase/phosphodiesterase n=1 Tax=Bradyrhizobium sp. (strain ORS 375) TaxID=566679 RepID=UPI00024074AD|nr:EAL domain-containing protein [Bradyrhizobium sp. ORS 375]CCD93701.1 putative signaling protein containing multidomains (PAS/GGDEF/EAL) [Bradyrhizobium sp. ORS 375]
MTTNTSPGSALKASADSSGPIRWLVGGGLVLIAAIAIGATIMADSFRERALNSATRELENTVLLLSRHFDQQMEDLGAIQRDLANYVRQNGIDTDARFKEQMGSAAVNAMLKGKLSATSYVGGVNIFDSDGNLINSAASWPLPPVNIADRTFFARLKADPTAPQLLIAPVVGRITGSYVAVIALKLTSPKGEFLGVISRSLEPLNVERFFASVALGPEAAISMMHFDGTLLARYPRHDGMTGQNYKDAPIFRQILSGDGNTTGIFNSPVDRVHRIGASHRLTSYPLIVTATTTVSAALADWREQMRFLIGVGVTSVLLIAGMLTVVVRRLIRDHDASSRRLMLEKERLDKAVNNMTQGLLLFDASERLVISNQRYIDMYGLSTDVVKPGCTFRELIAHRKASGSLVGDDREYASAVLRDVGRKKSQIIETPDGRSIQIVNEPIVGGGWLATHEDITERRRAEQQITHLAHYDALTELPNRTLFHERLKGEMAGVAEGRQLALHYIDIDEFKGVNDSLGHLIGDELLKSVARSLQACVGTAGFVARLGGDEFAVVQTTIKSREDVSCLIDDMLAAIRAPRDCLGHQLTADASIGVALIPQHGTDLDQIMKNADLAMYAAKAAGRRTWRFFEPEMDAQVKARHQLEVDLRQAMVDDQLEVYYQPCLSLQDDRIVGCEALVRWKHPTRGYVSPAEFIPIAEDTGLINRLGERVLNVACAEAATWPDDIRLAVNVSPVQFKSGTLALKVAKALAASGLSPRRLELEITEAVLIRDDDALDTLHELRALGVRIALDDFGTGYSSLSYLQRIPFDKIKIDRCFVKDITESEGSAAIVQAVVNIAAIRKMSTTAEGVETEAQRQVLKRLGCSEMQGYLFSPPKPAADVRGLFAAHRADGSSKTRPRSDAA